MDEKEKNRILRRFIELIPNPECPMCHGHHFTVIDSYPVNAVTEDFRKLSPVIRRSIPTVAVVCVKCGFISQHAMAVMGLINNPNDNVNDKKESEK